MNNVIAGPWLFPQKRAQGNGKPRSPQVAKETINTIPGSLRLPVKSGVISDTLFEKWVELLRLCGDRKSWYWTLKASNIRYKMRFWEPRDEPLKVYGRIEVFHTDSGVRRVYIKASTGEIPDLEMREAANSNVDKLLKGKISPEFEDEMISEIENQLGYLDQSIRSRQFKYGEHHLAHKLRWWKLIHRSQLTQQRVH